MDIGHPIHLEALKMILRSSGSEMRGCIKEARDYEQGGIPVIAMTVVRVASHP